MIKKKRLKRISTKGLLLIIFGLIPSILILVIFMIYIGYMQENALALESITKLACNLAETDIVATAVTIWVGLNIYNLITKEDLNNEINREVRNSEEKMKSRNNKILKNQLSKEVFLERLEKTRYRYAVSDFLVRHINELKKIKYEEAAEIERYLSLCVQNYETNRWNDATHYAKELLDYIKKRGLIKKAEKENVGVDLIYLYDRMGDAYFYMNANRGRGKKKLNLTNCTRQ